MTTSEGWRRRLGRDRRLYQFELNRDWWSRGCRHQLYKSLETDFDWVLINLNQFRGFCLSFLYILRTGLRQNGVCSGSRPRWGSNAGQLCMAKR